MRARPSIRQTLSTLFLTLALALPGAAPAAAAPPQTVHAQLDDEAIAERIGEIIAEEPDIEDTFEADDGLWALGYTGDTSVYYRAGQLRLAVDGQNITIRSDRDTIATDFYMEVESTHTDGPLDNQFGITFRTSATDNGDQYYYFAISSDGYYSFRRRIGDEVEWLVEWEASDLIETGEGSKNLIAVLAEGSTFILLVNDYVLQQVEDSTLSEGEIGLLVGAYDTPGSEIAFDNVRVWLLGEPAQAPERPARVPRPSGGTPTPEPGAPTPEPTEAPIEEPTGEPTEAPTEEPTPEPTGEPTEEPPAGSPEARIAQIRAEAPTYEEPFDELPTGWTPNETSVRSYTLEDGALVVEGGAANSMGWTLSDQTLVNFYLEVDATHHAGSLEAEYGVLFHFVDSSNFYFFGLNGAGQFSLWLLSQNEWFTLQPWTSHEAILPDAGATNRLGVLVEGPQITLLVNDVVVLETTDETIPSGAIALSLGTYTDEATAIAYDNLALWDLGGDLPVNEDPAAPTEEPPGEFEEIDARILEITSEAPTFSDDFRTDQGYWDLTFVENTLFFYQQRSLHTEISAGQWASWVSLQMDQETTSEMSDFYAEVDVSFVQQPPGAAAGLVFRHGESGDFYIFVIDPTGYYMLQKNIGGEWLNLIPWTETAVVDTAAEAVNRLGVLAEGSTLSFTINGVVIDSTEDSDLSLGGIALVTEALQEPTVEVAFDNFALWDLAQ
ncbi:MAG TPA: family 16 glycoside hydrolase [Caldilineaceae bacterium]|nr:family 16 glycoside hydrolase [Caldilineaceae bacterium]